jgi:lysophospholipase L1-like esterase
VNLNAFTTRRPAKDPHRGRRLVATLTVAVAMIGGLITPVQTAAAATRPFSASSALGSLGALTLATVTAPSGDFTLTVDGGVSYDPAVMQGLINQIQAQNPRLSDTIKQSVLQYPLGLPGDDTSRWQDFDGTLSMNSTDTGLSITIPASEVQTTTTWWQSVLASAVGAAIGYFFRGICLSAGPAAVVCTPVGGFIAGFVQGFITQAIDGTLGDPLQWGVTLLKAVSAAVGGYVWEQWAKNWFTNSLPGIAKNIADWIKLQARTAWAWMPTTLTGAISSAADFFSAVAQRLPDAAAWLVAHPTSNSSTLRILPFGDSITYGIGSSTTSSYRGDLQSDLGVLGHSYQFVGSQSSGSMPQPANEGHPGWQINQLAGIEPCTIYTYGPNVVLLHIGTNDLNAFNDLGNAPGRLKSLISAILRDDPTATVLVGSLMGTTASAQIAANMVTFNQQSTAMVNQMQGAGSHVAWVDMSAVQTSDLSDGLHPNDAGYAKMAYAWSNAIAKAGVAGWITDALNSPVPTPPPAGCGHGVPPAPILPGPIPWTPLGLIAGGVGGNTTVPPAPPPPGTGGGSTPPAPPLPNDQIIFADVNGDGRADYIDVHPDSSVTAYLNGGFPLGIGKGPIQWIPLGLIAGGISGGRCAGCQIQFADLNGDGRADYIVVHPDSSVTAYLNGGFPLGIGNGPIQWIPLGLIAGGVASGIPAGGQIEFADLNNDGLADYIVVNGGSAVTAYRNDGFPLGIGKGPIQWTPLGLIAGGVGAPGNQIQFADLNGDGWVDYINVHPDSSTYAFANEGFPLGQGNGPIQWTDRGLIAGGVSAPGNQIQFADLNGDGKADYIYVHSDTSVTAWLNGS